MIFWKWWSTVLVCITIFLTANYFAGISDYLLVADKSKISLGILIVTTICSLSIGYLAYKVQFAQMKIREESLHPYWFFSDVVLSLGMVGTLIGFLLVLTTTFNDIDNTSTEAMKKVIAELASGMGIALITSLTGLICSIILKFELVLLESENAKI